MNYKILLMFLDSLGCCDFHLSQSLTSPSQQFTKLYVVSLKSLTMTS